MVVKVHDAWRRNSCTLARGMVPGDSSQLLCPLALRLLLLPRLGVPDVIDHSPESTPAQGRKAHTRIKDRREEAST